MVFGGTVVFVENGKGPLGRSKGGGEPTAGGNTLDLDAGNGASEAFGRPDFVSVTSLSSVSLAPDAQLDGMKMILQKELPKISVDRYYQTFWVEEKTKFFKTWLEDDGKTKVEVGPWKTAKDGVKASSLVNPYDNETYDQIRTVTYTYNRSTSVYSGPVSVTMEQYARLIRRSRCIVSSTLQFSGMPYAKAFRVHLRWVASRRQKVNLKVQVGLCVVFIEQVLVASQIKKNTTQEMTQAQLSLFRTMKNVLGFTDANLKDTETLKKELHPLKKGILGLLFPFLGSSTKNDAQIKVEEAQMKLTRVRELPLKQQADDQEEQRQQLVYEMDAVHVALDAMLLRKFDSKERDSGSSGVDPKFSFIEELLRKIKPRKVRVRDPSMFDKKNHIDQIDLQRRDKTLTKMEVVVSSTIPDVSLKDFADTFLMGKQGNEFYTNWMTETDREKISIGPWEDEDTLKSLIVDDFSGEAFTLRRIVKATFDKAKFLRDGSPSVESTQTQEQFYRLDPDKRLVFATTTTVENVPFANAFEIHIRWVVTQLRTGELSVKVGLFCIFKKQALLEPKIRAGATKEGRRTQLDLFLKIKNTLGRVNEERTHTQRDTLAEFLTPTPRFSEIFPSFKETCIPKEGDVVESDDVLHDEFENARLKLRAVELFLKESEQKGDTEAMKFVLGELNVVNDAFDNIVDWHEDGGAPQALLEAGFS